jgi:hypothetical protein
MIQMASSSQRGRALVAEAVRRTTFRMRLGEGTKLMERRWSKAAALGSYMTRESRASAGRAFFTESGIVDGRRRARHCGACKRLGSVEFGEAGPPDCLQIAPMRGAWTKKRQLSLPFFESSLGCFLDKLLLCRKCCELLVEFLDAASRVHDLLITGVERMRFRRHFDLCQRVRLAFELAGFARVDRRTGDELEVVRDVDKQHFAVIRVNAFFHGLSLVSVGSQPTRVTGFARIFGVFLNRSCEREPLA